MIRRSFKVALFGIVFAMGFRVSTRSSQAQNPSLEREVYTNSTRLSELERQLNELRDSGSYLSRSDHTQIELLRAQVDQIRGGLVWGIAFLATNIAATALMMIRNYFVKKGGG